MQMGGIRIRYPADYACKVTVYAMSGTEGEPNISLPKETRIYQEGEIFMNLITIHLMQM